MSESQSPFWDPFMRPPEPRAVDRRREQAERDLAALARAVFGSPEGGAFLAALRAEITSGPSYVPGMSFDHVAHLEGQKAVIARIDALLASKET